MRPFREVRAADINNVIDLLRLSPDYNYITWQLDLIASKVIAGIPPNPSDVTRAKYMGLPEGDEKLGMLYCLEELGAYVSDKGFLLRYEAGRRLAAEIWRGGRLREDGTLRELYGCNRLYDREPRRIILGKAGASGLAELLATTYEQVSATGLFKPSRWSSAGDLASAQLRYSKPAIEVIEDPAPGEQLDMKELVAGGRNEVTAHGDVGTVYEYDQIQAYGAALMTLPPSGGRWREGAHNGEQLSRVEFKMARGTQPWLGPLPVRRPDQVLIFPRRGSGWYWERELKAAEAFGAEIKRLETWTYQYGLDKKINLALAQLAARLYRVKDDHPVKRVLPAIYGKFLQRKGKRRYYSLTYASLVTATVRASLLRAAALDPETVVMLITDAVWSLRPLPLDIGAEPGQWRERRHEGLHIVRPGLYWTAGDRLRTQGFRRSDIEAQRPRLEELWREHPADPAAPPEIVLTVELVGTPGLANFMRDASLIGAPYPLEMRLSYRWAGRRSRQLEERHYDGVPVWRSRALPGLPLPKSAPFDPDAVNPKWLLDTSEE